MRNVCACKQLSCRDTQGKYRKCRHRIFGEGEILAFEEPDKLAVRFPALGRKLIAASYVFVQDKAGQ